MTQIIDLIKQNAFPVAVAIIWYVAAGLVAAVFAKKTRIDAWCEANPNVALLLNLLRATGFDFWKALAALYTFLNQKVSWGPPMLPLFLALGLGLSSQGCSSMPWAKSAFDEWRSVCGKDLVTRADVVAEA